MALSSKKKLFSLFTPPPMSPILSPIGINSNGTMISNYFPTIETLEDRQLQQPTLEDIRKAGENFERLVAAAEAYRDLTIKIGKASKTLSKALKDYGNSKGMDNIHVMCLQTSSQFYEQNSEVQNKLNKVLQKDFDSLQKVSEKYFKKTTKEEKLHNENINELDKQVKKIGKDYEKKSKKDSKSSLESHDKYISSLTTVGSDIARARAEYMNQAIRRERSTHCVISQIICKIAEGNFAYFNDSLKKCGPFISKMKEWVPFAGEDMPQPLDLDSFLEDQALRSDDNSINSDKTLPEPYPNISEKKSSSTPNLLNYINNNSQLSFYSSPNSLPPPPQFTVEPNEIEVPKYTRTPEEIQKPLLPIESTTKKDSTSTKQSKTTYHSIKKSLSFNLDDLINNNNDDNNDSNGNNNNKEKIGKIDENDENDENIIDATPVTPNDNDNDNNSDSSQKNNSKPTKKEKSSSGLLSNFSIGVHFNDSPFLRNEKVIEVKPAEVFSEKVFTKPIFENIGDLKNNADDDDNDGDGDDNNVDNIDNIGDHKNDKNHDKNDNDNNKSNNDSSPLSSSKHINNNKPDDDKNQKNESVKLNNFNSTVTADVDVGVKSTFDKDSPKLNSENKISIIDNGNKNKTPIISKKISDDEYLIVSKKSLGYNQAIISHENIQTSQPPQKMPTKDEYQIIDADKHLIMQQKLRNSPPSNNLLEKYEGHNDEAIQEIYHSKSLHYANHNINNANNNIDDPDVIYSDYQQQKNYNFTSNEIFNNDNDYESNHHDNYNNMLSYMPKSFTSRERSTPRDDYEVYTTRKSYSTNPLPINKRGNSVADIKERFMTKHNSIDSNRSSSPPIRDLPRSISGRVNDIKSKLGDERNRSMNPSYLQLPKSNRGGDYHRNNMSYNDINNNNFYSDDLQNVDEHFINDSEEILTSGGNHHCNCYECQQKLVSMNSKIITSSPPSIINNNNTRTNHHNQQHHNSNQHQRHINHQTHNQNLYHNHHNQHHNSFNNYGRSVGSR